MNAVANILAYGGAVMIGIGCWAIYPPLVWIYGGALALLIGGVCYARQDG